MPQPIRNIAIMAHADAGKTTLTEQFLFLGGMTRQPGNVDQGTANTDFLPVEQERGISVRAAHTSFEWKETRINLIDTPGHVDFSSEVERTLRVCDGVILVISAVEGVQAHTETLWKALCNRKIPVLVFINKIDRVGADTLAVIHAIEKELKFSPMRMQGISGEGSNEVNIVSLWDLDSMQEKLVEQVVSGDEALMTHYLEGITPSFSELDSQLSKMTGSAGVYPLWFGSAKMGLGIEELLDAVVNYLPAPGGDPQQPLSALVYGIGHDKNRGKIAHVRLFNGRISSREVIHNATRHIDEKVTQVRRIFPGRYDDIGTVEAGDIAGISGFESVVVGDVLGIADSRIPVDVKLNTALIIVQVKAVNPQDYPALAG